MSLYWRLKHSLTARHYRGHGIHSPFLYDFIRTVLLKSSSQKDMLQRVEEKYNSRPLEISAISEISSASIVFLPSNILNHSDIWSKWRSENECLSIWLKYGILLFFDPKLPNQHFNIRS